MSKRNSECSLKYCQECKVRLHQGNCREEKDYVVLTRKCPRCKKKIHIVEMEKEQYNKTVNTLNTIIDVLSEQK